MVISTRPLVELVPVEPAAMEGRQLCQWDKDSCADAGFLKIDLLGLGMLSAVEECVEQIARLRGEADRPVAHPARRPDVYREIQDADTVGLFQIESRAQMQSLLRTRPENLDDLTVQVALVRPGPIQGKAVHPYIERRQRLREDPAYVPPYDHPLLAEPLRETLGAIIFQEQVLDVAMALAGFTVGEAEGLRRAMSRKRSQDAIEAYRERFLEGAQAQRRRPRRPPSSSSRSSRVRVVRLPEVARGRVRAARLPVGLAAPPLSGRVPLRAPERAADGLLSAGEPRAGRPAARRRGAAAGRQPERRDVLPLEGGAVRVGLGYIRGLGEEPAEALVAEREARRALPGASPTSRGARRSTGRRSRRSSRSGACDSFGWPRRQLLWRLGLAPRSASAARAERERQLALPLEPTTEIPELRRADALGADARRLPPHEPLRRAPSARAAAAAPAGGGALELGAGRRPRTAPR